MKKEYYSPICDRLYIEEDPLMLNSRADVTGGNPEGENGGTNGPGVDESGQNTGSDDFAKGGIFVDFD